MLTKNFDCNEKYHTDLVSLLDGDEKRLEVLKELCCRGATCVCDMCDCLDLTQSKLSYHLKILHEAGLIHKETKGTWSYYSVNEELVREVLSETISKQFVSYCTSC